jgi:hypothetical protein
MQEFRLIQIQGILYKKNINKIDQQNVGKKKNGSQLLVNISLACLLTLWMELILTLFFNLKYYFIF